VRGQDPALIASLVCDRLVFGSHPYGQPNAGTVDTLRGITNDDLRTFHHRYFVPNNAILAIVGDIDAAQALSSAGRTFGRWERRQVSRAAAIEPPAPANRLVIVDKPDAVQTEIRVGQLVVPRGHPDYVTADLAIKILGGEGHNRLQRVLRTERGLTYGAQADLDALEHAGDFVANTATRTESTGEVLRLLVDEIARLRREPVDERELAAAQAALSGSFPLKIETPDAIAAQVLNALFYRLPLSDLENYRDRVNAITPERIEQVARRVGFDRYEIIEIGDLDLSTADFRRPRRSVRHSSAASVGAPDSGARTTP
jgi:zinc protease